MLNRKLVYPTTFTLALLLYSMQFIKASTQPSPDSLQAKKDSLLGWIQQEYRHIEITHFPLGYYWELPALPANKTREVFVEQYRKTYARKMESIRKRSATYFAVMDSIFTRYQLPVELKYIAVVESELNTRALSQVGARGTWQLMPETARILKLRVNDHVDERTHLKKSTAAAALYLRDLYKMFDDWLLTMAAYNCGPGPVLKAIKLSGSRNFWRLQHLLPAETRGHVKKVIGTHYYFEGNGSAITLTKAERIEYGNRLQAFVAKHNLLLKDLQSTVSTPTAPDPNEPAPSTVRSNVDMHRLQEQRQMVLTTVEE